MGKSEEWDEAPGRRRRRRERKEYNARYYWSRASEKRYTDRVERQLEWN